MTLSACLTKRLSSITTLDCKISEYETTPLGVRPLCQHTMSKSGFEHGNHYIQDDTIMTSSSPSILSRTLSSSDPDELFCGFDLESHWLEV